MSLRHSSSRLLDPKVSKAQIPLGETTGFAIPSNVMKPWDAG
jgi:hypothetical protein